MNTQVIGYVGENGTRDVQIPVGHLLEKWPDLSPSILMVPVGGADDDAYPVDSELVGSDLVWHVSATDTAVIGTTKASVRMTAIDGRVALDEPFTVIVSQNLSAGGTPPSPIQPWVDRLAELTTKAEKAADDANTAADRANDAAQNWEEGTAANASLLANKPPEYYLTPVNLLDNSDFANPVNQRGQTTYSGSGTYAIDRWYVGGSNQRIDVASGSIKGVTTKGSAYTSITQNVANITRYAGKTLTFAAYVRSNVVPRLNILNGDNSFANTRGTSGDYQLITCSFVVPDGIAQGALSVRIQSISTQVDDYVEAKWAALYEGTYTAETLPPYVPKGYGAELTECQRYFVRINCKNKPLGFGHAFTTDAIRILVPTPASMMTHKAPTITFETSDGVESDAAGTMLIATAGSLLTPTAVNSDGAARENGVICLCTVSGATKYQPASMYCSGIISFSADL